MLDSVSNPGFLQKFIGRLSALTAPACSANGCEDGEPIEVNLQVLEDRVLYSAVPVPTDLVVQVDTIDSLIEYATDTLFVPAEDPFGTQESLFDVSIDSSYAELAGGFSIDDSLASDSQDGGEEGEQTEVRNELIVVDRNVDGYQQLVDSLFVSGNRNRTFEIIYLEENVSGIESLSNELSNRLAAGTGPYDAIHLVSHGTDGTIQLGTDRLSTSNLDQFRDSIAGWGASLTVDADLLIYGCDVAQSESGQDFIDEIAALTGADVAASDNITGHQSLGGDWRFEYLVGDLESNIAFSQTVQQSWMYSLADQTAAAANGGQVKSIGVDAAGRSTIVTSVDDMGVTDGFDVYMRFEDQFGNVTDEILVNETIDGDQTHASVAVAENGSKAITWTSVSTSGEQAVFAKFYDGSNSVVQGEFRVDVPSMGVESGNASVAIDAAGNVVIVWESSEAGVAEILAQRYSVDGTPVGSTFTVNEPGFTATDQSANAQVAMNDSGQFVVVWDTHNGSTNDPSIIYARTYNADGTANSSTIVVQQNPTFQNTQASVDIDSAGNFVVGYTIKNLVSTDELGVRAESRSFDGTQVAFYSDFVEDRGGDQFGTSVALLDNGNVRISWEGEGLNQLGGADPQEVYAATVDFATGDVISSQQSLSPSATSTTLVDRFNASVTTNYDGSFSAAYLFESMSGDEVSAQSLPSGSNNATPTGSDQTLTLPEDGMRIIVAGDFGFSDTDGGTFTQVQISRLPQNGRLLLNGVDVATGQVITASEISSGDLVYIPEDDYSGQDTLLFFVHDGTDYSDAFSTLTFEVQPEVDGLLTSFGTSYTSTSGGIPVDSINAGEQNRPKVAATQDGGYFVVWESVDTDLAGDSDGNGDNNDGQQIYLQRFDASNNKVGSKILVGGNLEGDQARPFIITLADGSFVVAATTTNDSGETDVFAQKIDLNGNVLFADGTVDGTGNATIALAEHVLFAQNFVSLTALREGGFIAAWSTLDTTLESDASFATVARIFDADGNAGSEFLLNNADVAPDSSGQFSPRIAELNGNSLVATWYDNLLDRVMYRVFDASGTPLMESQTVSEAAGIPEFNPRVASLGSDGFVIAWRQNDVSTAASEIVARRFDLDGTPATTSTQVLNANTSTFHAFPEIVGLNDGGFIAVWNSFGSDNHSMGVAGARFDADLNPTTDTFVVNSAQYGTQREPALAVLSTGELVVTYLSSDGDNNGATYGNGVFVERLSPVSVADEDTAVPLNLVFSNIDEDGSEYADQVQLSGLPAGSQLTDGVVTVDITGPEQIVDVTGLGMVVEDLAVTPPTDFYGDISVDVTFAATDSNGLTTASAAPETQSMLIRVNPSNDAATYDPIVQTVSENGTAQIDLDTFFAPGNDPDNAGINPTVTPLTAYDLDPSAPLVDTGGILRWNSTSGEAGAITFDSAEAQFNQNPTTDYPGIDAAIDLDGSGGGDFSIDGAKSLEVWFRPDLASAQQTLVEFGDADAGWGLYLTNGQIELHFRSSGSATDVAPYVLIGGQLSSSEFNQVVVSFSTDGDLAGEPTQPDVALFVNGERVDLLTDAQFLGDLNPLIDAFNGSLGATSGGFTHASTTNYANFVGSIASLNVFDQALDQVEVQHRFFDVAHGHHIVQVDGQNVNVGTATTLSSGAIVTYNADGTITYDPNGQFEQLDEFNAGNADSYQRDDFSISVSDGQGDTQTLTVQLTVEGENDAPTVSFSPATPEPTTASVAGELVATASGSDVDTNGGTGITYSLTGAISGAFVIDSNTGEIRISDLNIYQNPPGGLPHEITVMAQDLAGGSSQSTYTLPIVTVPTGQITGTIYEDAVGDGSIAGDTGVDGVTVNLYLDNGDGVRDSNDLFVAATTTSGGGSYVFQGPAIAYRDYFIVVDSSNITSTNGFNGSFGTNDVWAEQTYASAGGLYLNEFGVETVSAGGALFGGYSGTRSDDASTLAGAEHVSQVTVSGTSNGLADFGFSFNVVTNTLGGDDQDDDVGSPTRSVQGSLRQFIQNANAIDNSDASDVDNQMRFVARNDPNSADSTWWSIVVSEALPEIKDSHTTIDGTVYAADGSGVLDSRTSRSGTPTTVGANDSHSLTGFDQPELEIVADQTLLSADRVLNGLVFEANANQTTLSDVSVRNLSIHGFGSTSGDGANIFLAGGGIDSTSAYLIDSATIENTFVGYAPDGSHGTVFRSQGIKIFRANNGAIQDSLIGAQGLSGIHFMTNSADGGSSVATGWQILRNEVRDNGASDIEYDGINLGNSSGTVVRHNLIANNAGFGIDSDFAAGGFTISENTVTGNGTGGFDQGGVRLFGSNSVVSQNRIINNAGTGISVLGTTELGSSFQFAGTGNELTQNQFGNNTGIDIDLVSSLTAGQAFADITVDGTPVVGLDTDSDNSLIAAEIAGTELTLAEHDSDSSGSISRAEYNAAQAERNGQGDGVSASDGVNVHSGNEGLDRPELVSAELFPDRVDLEFDLAAGIDRVELYDFTAGTEERVTYVTSLLVSNMTFDAGSGTYRISINPAPVVSGQLTAVAFEGANTSEFSNRVQLNGTPSAQSNSISTTEDTPRSLSQSDFGYTDTEDQSDVSQGTISISSVTGGTLQLSGADVSLPATLSRSDLDNLVFYPTPDSNAQGAINFRVTDSDGSTNGATYTLTVNVTAVNDIPSAQNNTILTLEDTPRSLAQADFGFSDVEDQSDVSKGTINISSVAGGTLQLNGSSISLPATLSRSDLDNLVFDPPLNSTAQGLIGFEVYDSDGATDGTTYTLTIDVTPQNDQPTITSPPTYTLQEDTPRVIVNFGAQLRSTGSDPDGDPFNGLEIATDDFAPGVFIYDSVLDTLSVNLPQNLNGTVTLDYTLQFGDDFVTDAVTFVVNPENDPPETQFDRIRIIEDTSLNLSDEFSNLLVNDSDPDGDSLSVVAGSFSTPTHGTLAFDSSSGDLIYTPNADSAHTETLTYEVSDGTTTATSTLEIVVEAENDAPVLNAPGNVTVDENSVVVGTPTGSDIEDGTASWVIVGGQDAARFTNDGGTLKFVNAPDYENATDQGQNNEYRVRLAAVDSEGLQSESQLVVVSVSDVNEAPVALASDANATVLGTGNESSGSINLNSLVKEFDAGDSLIFTVREQPEHGTVSINPDGSFTYSPGNPSPDSQDSFQFVATDSRGLQSEVVTVNLNVLNTAVIASSSGEDETGGGDENESTAEETEQNEENSETTEDSATSPTISGTETGADAGEGADGIEVPLIAPRQVNSNAEASIEFNGYDGNETSDFETDNSSYATDRTYAYELNNDSDLSNNPFSIDRTIRRRVRVAQFDVDVLASAFLEELDSSKHQYLQNQLAVGAPEVAASAATLLTMSYLVWNMASGLLLSTFMSSLPAWSSFDVLPVIASSGMSVDDGESIEQMVDA